MKRRPRYVLSTLGIGTGLIFMIYAWLAWAPTGYDEFEREFGRSEEHNRQSLQDPMAPNPTPQGSDAAPQLSVPDPTTSQCVATSKTAPPVAMDFFAALEDLRIQSNGVFHNYSAGDIRQTLFFGSLYNVMRTRLPDSDNSGPGKVEPFTAEDERVLLAEAACLLAWRKCVRQTLGGDSQITNPADSISTAALNELLNKAETFLLSEWRAPDYANSPFPDHATILAFQSASILAVARACLHNGGENSARLLERYLKARMLFYQAGDLDHAANSLDLAAALLPSEFDNFSSEGLLRAQKTLEASMLSPKELEARGAAYAIRYRNETFREIQEQHVISSSNLARRLIVSLPRQVAWEFVKPVLRRQVESVALAYARGDADAFNAARDNLHKIEPFLADCELPNPVWNTRPVWGPISQPGQIIVFHNRRVNQLCMALAATRFRRAEGRWPRNPGELVPLYLNRGALDSELSFRLLDKGNYPAFAIEEVQEMYLKRLRSKISAIHFVEAGEPLPAHIQTSAQQSNSGEAVIFPAGATGADAVPDIKTDWTPEKAVNAFWAKNGRLPVSHNDILTGLDDPMQAAQLGDSFVNLDARIVFCITQNLPRREYPTADSIKSAVLLRHRLPMGADETAEIERRLPGFINSTRELVAASVSAPDLPLIDPKILPLLRRAQSPLASNSTAKGAPR